MKKLLIPLVLLVSQTSFANEKGNGGISYVCRDENNQITKARLLDLWEPETFETDQDDTVSYQEQLEKVMNRIKKFRAESAKDIQKTTELIAATTIFTKKPLPLTNDAIPDYSPEPGCAFEQVARWGYSNEFGDSRLRIYREIFESPVFSQSDKAALILHESLYLLDTKNNKAVDSRLTRRIVSRLFSKTNVPTEIKKSLIEITGYRKDDKFYLNQPSILFIYENEHTFKIKAENSIMSLTLNDSNNCNLTPLRNSYELSIPGRSEISKKYESVFNPCKRNALGKIIREQYYADFTIESFVLKHGERLNFTIGIDSEDFYINIWNVDTKSPAALIKTYDIKKHVKQNRLQAVFEVVNLNATL